MGDYEEWVPKSDAVKYIQGMLVLLVSRPPDPVSTAGAGAGGSTWHSPPGRYSGVTVSGRGAGGEIRGVEGGPGFLEKAQC